MSGGEATFARLECRPSARGQGQPVVRVSLRRYEHPAAEQVYSDEP
jgi:hypothetical protein